MIHLEKIRRKIIKMEEKKSLFKTYRVAYCYGITVEVYRISFGDSSYKTTRYISGIARPLFLWFSLPSHLQSPEKSEN
jgi:hypothetical protein